MKVHILHCLSGTDFFAAKGDIVDVPDEEAARLIRSRYARKLTPAEAKLNPEEDEVEAVDEEPAEPAADAKAKVASRAAKLKAAAASTTTGA